uniref:Cysteine sulfinic acid decarboxylase n=1 Tax=Ciona intestinalis TaxID=7719 RepID=Q8T8A6_CIOIN|nr:cysteine sulfinic acid decarboxylase [Ciona intestinalis]BAB88855.1 cysteine sulfinic acid decarboxylase [Ciona intestinalis]|eukprot:NP_001027786.1 cysteine sulfinic acid decarboxylase [Ciona intestinalis]
MNGCHESDIETFLKSVFDLVLKEGVTEINDRTKPVINFKTPSELKQILDLAIPAKPASHAQLLEYCEQVFKYSVKTGHPRFFNQLYAGLDPYGFAGQVVTDVLNTSIYTYEVAPVFVLMEKYLLDHVCHLIGYKEGDGTFSPGGSYSNMLGMNLARFHKFPQVSKTGMRALPRIVIFVSKHSHYSNKKNASLLGIGSDDVIAVATDNSGRMDCSDLKQKIEEAEIQGATPFLVIATCGTTVLGAFDPLEKIADICEDKKLWLHVDAAWGGGVLFSSKYRQLCKGIHRSDSVAWNPHKMLMAPLQCCVFVTKHSNKLVKCHSIEVPYLFQQDKTLYSSEYDIGSKVIQCGRKVDVLKLWLMMKAHGSTGLETRINKAFLNAQKLTKLVEVTEGFELVCKPECTNVCFWYIPKRLRSLKWSLDDDNFCRKMAQVPPLIKEGMTQSGSLMVGYQPLDGKPSFFRMVVINDKVTTDDMEFVIKEIDRLGSDL